MQSSDKRGKQERQHIDAQLNPEASVGNACFLLHAAAVVGCQPGNKA
jgi:hypothetical protein